jgi:hypothetical protein
MPRRRRLIAPALICALATAVVAGCGQGDSGGGKPVLARKGDQSQAARSLGFPGFATKNTTRVGGADATADAAAISLAVYSGALTAARPPAVALVGDSDWQAGIAASVLMSRPTRAPILLSSGDSVPAASRDALSSLKPLGSKQAGGAQLIRVGSVASPSGLKTTAVGSGNPFALAASIDRLHARAAGKPSDRVMVVSGERPEFAMPAAAWAAKAGDPVLYVTRDSVPPETQAALKFHQQPKIYLLGPPDVVSAKVEKALAKLGTVRRIAGSDPITNAIAFARFSDGPFGWGVANPGHGLVFASDSRPLDAAAAAPLSATGKYGPLLLVEPGKLAPALIQYLLDIQPGYDKDPVLGVYNHGWLIGDLATISLTDQSRIDELLEIVPVSAPAAPPTATPPTATTKTTPTPKPSQPKKTKTTPTTKTTTLIKPPPAPPRVTR